MSEMGAEISLPTQETTEPVKNLVENIGWFFYAIKNVTRPSESKSFTDLDQRTERPISLRQARATLLKKFYSIPKENKEERKKVIEEAHLRDEITQQYLNQGDVSVSSAELGRQTARYVSIIPPEPLQNDLTKRPIIVLIPGISNDLDCVGALMQEAAFEGRRITSIAYPESYMGTVTDEFAKAVEGSPDYTPHVEFFKQAIKSLLKEDESIELWGYSTGAPIVEQILNDPQFQEKTTNAVLLCPASSVDQSAGSLNMGILNEIGLLKKHFPFLSRFTLTAGSKELRDKRHEELRKRVMNGLLKKVARKYDFWKQAKVREGGNIILVSGQHDQVTKSHQAIGEFSQNQNPQIQVLPLPDGYHATPGINPQGVLPEIFRLQP